MNKMTPVIDNNNINLQLEFWNRALEKDGILLRIFSFLPLSSIKQCRLVCCKWKEVSEQDFKTRVRLCFDFGKGTSEIDKFTFTEYPAPENLKEFVKELQKEVRFSAMRLSYDVIWSPSLLAEFFATEGRFLQDLILYRVNLPTYDTKPIGNYLVTYDLMNLIGGILNLKSLKFQTLPENPSDMLVHCTNTEFSLKLLHLYNFAEISLSGCEIQLADHKISPIKLHLKYIVFTRNDKSVPSVILNDFVNFGDLEELSIANNYDETNIQLDLNGGINLKKLSLNNVNLLNFNKSSLVVDTLILERIPFVHNFTEMKIKNLGLLNCVVDMNYVPQLCVNLSFSATTFKLPTNSLLPNVNCLELCGSNVIKSIMPFLTIFPNLSELRLLSRESVITIDINWIPKCVRKLQFSYYYFQFIGKEVRVLDALVLKGSTLGFAHKMIHNFAPGKFTMFVDNLKAKDCHGFLLDAAKKWSSEIVFALFDWKNSRHKLNSISSSNDSASIDPMVEFSEEFYAFVNGRGDVIACEDHKIVCEMANSQWPYNE